MHEENADLPSVNEIANAFEACGAITKMMNYRGDPMSKHDTCYCPRCKPDQWPVADLIAAIRDRDDVLDCLLEAARDILIYRDSAAHREKLRQTLVDMYEVERSSHV